MLGYWRDEFGFQGSTCGVDTAVGRGPCSQFNGRLEWDQGLAVDRLSMRRGVTWKYRWVEVEIGNGVGLNVLHFKQFDDKPITHIS